MVVVKKLFLNRPYQDVVHCIWKMSRLEVLHTYVSVCIVVCVGLSGLFGCMEYFCLYFFVCDMWVC